MAFDEGLSDRELTSEQQRLISQFTEEEIVEIDTYIVSSVGGQWCKVAKIVGQTMQDMPCRLTGVPDVFYSQRVWKLIEVGHLEYQGFIGHMRYCEVRRISTNVSDSLRPVRVT